MTEEKVEEIVIKNVSRKRHWSVKRRVEFSRKIRKTSKLEKKTKKGTICYELVLHLRGQSVSKRILVYEAYLNNTTLEEWTERHRIGGEITGNEVYLKIGMHILHLNRDVHDCRIENMYCFRSIRQYRSWVQKNVHKQVRLIKNKDEILDLCLQWTTKARRKAAKEGHPQLWGVLRMTHMVELNVGINTNFLSDAIITLRCCLTGQQVFCANVPHIQVELEDKQRFWVAACRIRERTPSDY